MTRVSLVCTVHKELGSANASWLHQLLLGLKPDVIFLEISPADYGDFYEAYKRSSLESQAIRNYQESHRVKLEPVDLDVRNRDFCESEDQMFTRIWDESPMYRDQIRTDTDRVVKHGFFYLNSDYNNNHWDDAHLEMGRTVERLNDPKLTAYFNLWKRTNANRENAMVQNIQNYCVQNAVTNGLFLIGSAHRKRILEYFNNADDVLATKIEWKIPELFQAEN